MTSRRPTETSAPTRYFVYITKPTAHTTQLKSTIAPNVKTATQPNISHKLNSKKNFPTTTQDSKVSPESGASRLTQELRDEANTYSSSVLSPSPGLSNRKNKPVRPHFLQNVGGGGNQTAVTGNSSESLEGLSDEYSSGYEPFLFELIEEGGSFSLYEFDAALSFDKDRQSDFNGASAASVDDVEKDSSPSPTHLEYRLFPETFASHNKSQMTVSQTQTHHRTLNNTTSSGREQGEISHTHAFPPKMETWMSQPKASLFLSSPSSLLFVQPTPSLPVVQLSSPAVSAEQTLSSSSTQREDVSLPSTDLLLDIRLSFSPPHPLPIPLFPSLSTLTAASPSSQSYSILLSASSPLSSVALSSAAVSPQQAEGNPLERDGVTRSAHAQESDRASRSYQSFVPTPPPPFSNLQKDSEVSVDDEAASLSLSASSKVLAESQMPVVDSSLMLSAVPESYSEVQLSHLGGFLSSAETFLDSSFRQIKPTPSGSFTADLPPQTETDPSQLGLLDLESSSSEVLWSSSHPGPPSVSQFLVNSGQRDFESTDSLPDDSETGFTFLASDSFLQRSHSVPLSASSNPPLLTTSSFSYQPDNILRVSSVTRQMLGEAASVPSSSPSLNPSAERTLHSVETSISMLQDRLNSSLTFNEDPPGLHETIPHLQSSKQLGTNTPNGTLENWKDSKGLNEHDVAFNHTTSPSSNRSFAIHRGLPEKHDPTTPLHASVPTHVSTEHSRHLLLDAMGDQSKSESPLLASFSLATILTPPSSPFNLSPIPPSTTVSSVPSSPLTLQSHRPSWVPLPASSANMEEVEIGALSSNWPTPGFHHPTATQTLTDNQLHSLQKSSTAESIQQSVTVSQPNDKLRPDHSPEFEDKIMSGLANNSQTANTTRFVDSLAWSPEASENDPADQTQSHLSVLFDPADVIPKILTADNQAFTEVSTTDDKTHDVTARVQISEQHDVSAEEILKSESFSTFPTLKPSSAHPTVAPVLSNPLQASGLDILSSTPSSRPPIDSSISTPSRGFISGHEGLPPPGSDNHSAGSNHTSTSHASTVLRPGNSPSVQNVTKDGNRTTLKEHGSFEGLNGSKETPDPSMDGGNLTALNPALYSNPSVSNHSLNQGSVFTNVALNFNQNNSNIHLSTTPAVIINSHQSVTTKNLPLKPLSASASSLKKATEHPVPGSPSVDLSAGLEPPCQCKERFHFTCLCGLSSGNSM